MVEREFIQILTKNLGKGIGEEDRKELLSDYHEHFVLGRDEGKSDGQIVQSLGDPAALGKSIRVDFFADRADESHGLGNVTKAVFASLSLGLFNLIFIVGPYAGLLGVLIGLWAAAGSIAISGVAAILAAIFEPAVRLFIPYIYHGEFWMHLVSFFGGTFLTSLGLLACIGMAKVTREFFRLTLRYIRFNKKIIVK